MKKILTNEEYNKIRSNCIHGKGCSECVMSTKDKTCIVTKLSREGICPIEWEIMKEKDNQEKINEVMQLSFSELLYIAQALGICVQDYIGVSNVDEANELLRRVRKEISDREDQMKGGD